MCQRDSLKEPQKKSGPRPLWLSVLSFFFVHLTKLNNSNLKGSASEDVSPYAVKSGQVVFWKPVFFLFSLADRCGGWSGHIWRGGAGGGVRRALVGPQEDFVLGGRVLSPALLVGQEFLEPGRGEGESLPAEAHQVGVLEPGVVEAVLNGGAGPAEEIFKSNKMKGMPIESVIGLHSAISNVITYVQHRSCTEDSAYHG